MATYDIDFFSLHIAPYNENKVPGLIILSKGGSDHKLYRCIQSLILTGHVGTVISHDLSADIKKFIGGSISFIKVPDNIDLILAQILLIIRSFITASKVNNPRIKRLYNEIYSLHDIVNDLYERYGTYLLDISTIIKDTDRKVAIISTCPGRSLAEGIAELSYINNRYNIDVFDFSDIYNIDALNKYTDIIAIYTETEFHLTSKIIMDMASSRSLNLIKIVLRTDPIASSIYFRLLYLIMKGIYMKKQ